MSLDPAQGDFSSLQKAINALPSSGGKIFAKAGAYTISSAIEIRTGNIQIQGEGMGIMVFMADASMTGDTPALGVFSTASDGTPIRQTLQMSVTGLSWVAHPRTSLSPLAQ